MTLLSASGIDPNYLLIIGGSLIVIISFVFNFISKATNIPSVLMLMVLGVAVQFLVPDLDTEDPLIKNTLKIVGKIGLILIVLEAALDLKLNRDKVGLIIRSFLVALFALGLSSVLIAFCIQWFLDASFYKALVYAVPLSIMSSAIIIPSVSSLSEEKKFIGEPAAVVIRGIVVGVSTSGQGLVCWKWVFGPRFSSDSCDRWAFCHASAVARPIRRGQTDRHRCHNMFRSSHNRHGRHDGRTG